MVKESKQHPVTFIQDMDKAVFVMRDAGKWLEDSGKNPSKWWQLKNLNPKFLLQYAKSSEFFVGLACDRPAVAAILQMSQEAQDWKSIDKDTPKSALYIHWLSVHRDFSGKNLSQAMTDFAEQIAKQNNISLLRVDTNAEDLKLRHIYEKLGFNLAGTIKEDYRETAFYEKEVA